jgi:hypothetical protein
MPGWHGFCKGELVCPLLFHHTIPPAKATIPWRAHFGRWLRLKVRSVATNLLFCLPPNTLQPRPSALASPSTLPAFTRPPEKAQK